MRENCWHIRKPTIEHNQWFKNIFDIHSITIHWLRELNVDKDFLPHQMKRVQSPGIKESLEILEKLTESSLDQELEKLLDHAFPEELLLRLEHTVWSVQAWSLRSVVERTPKEEQNALKNALEQSSWKTGRTCFQNRWPSLPDRVKKDLRGVLASFQDSPISGYPHRHTFLIKRAIPNKLQIELFSCPHQSQYLEINPVADDLCQLYSHWMRGFAYGINPQILLSHQNREKHQERCSQTWTFHEGKAMA